MHSLNQHATFFTGTDHFNNRCGKPTVHPIGKRFSCGNGKQNAIEQISCETTADLTHHFDSFINRDTIFYQRHDIFKKCLLLARFKAYFFDEITKVSTGERHKETYLFIIIQSSSLLLTLIHQYLLCKKTREYNIGIKN